MFLYGRDVRGISVQGPVMKLLVNVRFFTLQFYCLRPQLGLHFISLN